MGWEVADIEATVTALRARGVVFEEYEQPVLKTVNGIAEIAGHYPSKGNHLLSAASPGRQVICDRLTQRAGAKVPDGVHARARPTREPA